MSLAEVLTTISARTDEDTAFLLAASINLYSESIRRREGRILYTPEDIRRLLGIWDAVTAEVERETDYKPSARAVEPSKVEAEMISDLSKLKRSTRREVVTTEESDDE